jgi:hypothetical protein
MTGCCTTGRECLCQGQKSPIRALSGRSAGVSISIWQPDGTIPSSQFSGSRPRIQRLDVTPQLGRTLGSRHLKPRCHVCVTLVGAALQGCRITNKLLTSVGQIVRRRIEDELSALRARSASCHWLQSLLLDGYRREESPRGSCGATSLPVCFCGITASLGGVHEAFLGSSRTAVSRRHRRGEAGQVTAETTAFRLGVSLIGEGKRECRHARWRWVPLIARRCSWVAGAYICTVERRAVGCRPR